MGVNDRAALLECGAVGTSYMEVQGCVFAIVLTDLTRRPASSPASGPCSTVAASDADVGNLPMLLCGSPARASLGPAWRKHKTQVVASKANIAAKKPKLMAYL